MRSFRVGRPAGIPVSAVAASDRLSAAAVLSVEALSVLSAADCPAAEEHRRDSDFLSFS